MKIVPFYTFGLWVVASISYGAPASTIIQSGVLAAKVAQVAVASPTEATYQLQTGAIADWLTEDLEIVVTPLPSSEVKELLDRKAYLIAALRGLVQSVESDPRIEEGVNVLQNLYSRPAFSQSDLWVNLLVLGDVDRAERRMWNRRLRGLTDFNRQMQNLNNADAIMVSEFTRIINASSINNIPQTVGSLEYRLSRWSAQHRETPAGNLTRRSANAAFLALMNTYLDGWKALAESEARLSGDREPLTTDAARAEWAEFERTGLPRVQRWVEANSRSVVTAADNGYVKTSPPAENQVVLLKANVFSRTLFFVLLPEADGSEILGIELSQVD